MKLHFCGGFSERGRISVGLATSDTSILFDVGINTSGTGADYYPRLTRAELSGTAAILISHSHEDHIGALGWCLSQGFRGRVLMTRETRSQMDPCLADYAEPGDRARAAEYPIEAFQPGEILRIGNLTIQTGRSGHAVGGTWFRAAHSGGPSVLYCGDVVPNSPVLVMDEPPRSDVVLFDASYGEDLVSVAERNAQIRGWVDRAGGACLLPTPLTGRALELLALLPPGIAIDRELRSGLSQQIGKVSWLRSGAAEALAYRLAGAKDWSDSEPFPAAPLVTHDGMGIAGPSALAIPRALREGIPILFTGYLPTNSAGEIAVRESKADWIRLPTHPTWPETLDLIASVRPRLAIGHSCSSAVAESLVAARPSLIRVASTGEIIDLGSFMDAHPD